METAKLLPPAVVAVLSACRLSLSRRFALGAHVENGRRRTNSGGGGGGGGVEVTLAAWRWRWRAAKVFHWPRRRGVIIDAM